MTTMNLNLDTTTFHLTNAISKKMGFAYVGDYVSSILQKQSLVDQAQLELDGLLLEGFSGKRVEATEEFYANWEKKLGVVNNSYED
jgi:hypothetical protein